MAFDKLLEEIELMTKALPADGKDDKNIQAAAAGGEGSGDMPQDNDDDDEDDDGGVGGGEGGEPMGKSMLFTLADGTQMEAVDGTELVKSLQAEMLGQGEQFAKAMSGLMGIVKAQGDLIKSLQEQVKKQGSEGRGRKAVVSVTEKPASEVLQKSEPAGLTPNEFMAKAMDAMKAGRLRGSDISLAEAALNRGAPIPPHIVQAVSQ